MIKEDMLSGAQSAADYLGITRTRVYRMVEQGHLPVVRMGLRMFFSKAALDRAFAMEAAASEPAAA